MQILGSILKGGGPVTHTPLHVGEVMALWTYMVALGEGKTLCSLMIQHTADAELKQLLQRYIDQVENPHANKLEQFMAAEGIPIAPGGTVKPRADEAAIPPGAKLNDEEIANILVAKLTSAMQTIGAGMFQVLRDDVGMMLLGFYADLLDNSFAVKSTMRRRGWLKVPPLYYGHAGSSSE